MTVRDDSFYERAIERIQKVIQILGALGTVVLFAWRGWAWGAGFALGAVVSWLNFRGLKRIGDVVGGSGPRPRVGWVLILRYLLLGAGAYVILRYSKISLPAALAGLFVTVAAVLIEILIQIVYARN